MKISRLQAKPTVKPTKLMNKVELLLKLLRSAIFMKFRNMVLYFGVTNLLSFITGRCPVLLLAPFQGAGDIKQIVFQKI